MYSMGIYKGNENRAMFDSFSYPDRQRTEMSIKYIHADDGEINNFKQSICKSIARFELEHNFNYKLKFLTLNRRFYELYLILTKVLRDSCVSEDGVFGLKVILNIEQKNPFELMLDSYDEYVLKCI